MDKLQFEIDQIRKDKIIYAVEATATAGVCILVFLFSNVYLKGTVRDLVNILALTVAVGDKLYQSIGNVIRWMKIKKLEKKL